jgi:copper(I)-binding protein
MAVLGAVLFFGGAAQADGFDVGPMHIGDVWARTTPKGASSAAVYLTVTNGGTTPDRMSCVSADAAGQCQIHTMSMENGVMKMRPVEGGVEIRPGESVTLKPGADHLMLTQLKHPLETGSSIQATLQFEKAGTVKVDVPVLAMGAAAPGTGAGSGSMMMQGHDHMMMQPGK